MDFLSEIINENNILRITMYSLMLRLQPHVNPFEAMPCYIMTVTARLTQ